MTRVAGVVIESVTLVCAVMGKCSCRGANFFGGDKRALVAASTQGDHLALTQLRPRHLHLSLH